ncbi:tRNA pseudouridine(55) synthase TruB [Myroides marinus]|uniref:tRNA pseudouridine(55) synthase TruB n=1 Tax=Myroides marinus TaxID=703342 RepID=UPI002578904D|nr:tRNA pseudouridine(55) synthase TruB [Myroides marinus]MDM1369913.1 tRNA pseudouridine(55) synthase TruB [Myroides marinus]MDM1376102.1 tRNA pseudouridine(55) synthase TruB [Myroides marinus]MDM1384154.1 tRNA pseudouridine(55) synthase TruB [Myroides marinus]
MIQYNAEAFQNGQILLIDKPLHWSSFQAVNKIKWLLKKHFDLKKIKVGHAGTLDPLASGLLIICTGKSTKQISELQGQIKEYTGTITLGGTTPSYDLETEIDQTFPTEHITEVILDEARLSFMGTTEQRPPIFSALKKDGKRLYEHARKGEEVEIATRSITIEEFELTKTELPNVDFRVVCSKGTYIRSLAYDFGHKVNSGAHLSALRRTKIGDFDVINAVTPEEFEEQVLKAIAQDN